MKSEITWPGKIPRHTTGLLLLLQVSCRGRPELHRSRTRCLCHCFPKDLISSHTAHNSMVDGTLSDTDKLGLRQSGKCYFTFRAFELYEHKLENREYWISYLRISTKPSKCMTEWISVFFWVNSESISHQSTNKAMYQQPTVVFSEPWVSERTMAEFWKPGVILLQFSASP